MHCEGPGCTNEIEQKSGGHRARKYCSDRCRVAARRQRMGSSNQPRQIQADARAEKERARLTKQFGLLTPESLDLLLRLKGRDAELVLLVGQALARERDQALANHHRAEAARVSRAIKARKLAESLGYPASDALDLSADESDWRRKLMDPATDLDRVFAELARLAEKIKVLKVELYLRVENNNKFIRARSKVRDEIERYVLSSWGMEKQPNGDYILSIPYETEEELGRIIERDILQEAWSTADARHCFIEADVRALDGSDRSWS